MIVPQHLASCKETLTCAKLESMSKIILFVLVILALFILLLPTTSVVHAQSSGSKGSAYCDPATNQDKDGNPCTGSSNTLCTPSIGGDGVRTALGCLPTDPKNLVSQLLQYALGAAGGVALLLMGFGALQIITSQGNAEALKNGQGRFTSAIIGLLFIIFSVFLLQVIGVDILNLPGFKR